jgi:pimeloyl-ACP methyl ester carboxylesterase
MTRLRRWIFRIGVGLFGLVLLVLLAGFAYEQIGRSHDTRDLPRRIGQAVDVGGRTLNLYCSGEGSPTVILETGGNDPGYAWMPVQTKLATFIRVCWYDRACVGWSDRPQGPRTSVSVVSDVHEMLGRAGVPPPYVLVGASIGGEYARVYTSRYPQDVAWLVFVDSAHPDEPEPAFMLSAFNRMSPATRHSLCTALPLMARFGMLRFISSRMASPPPSQVSPEAEILAKLNAQPKALRTDAEQGCAATDGGRLVPALGTGNPELDNAARIAGSLDDRPLVVLTAGRYWAPTGLEKQAADYHELWIHQLQASLARLSRRGRQVVVDAHHDMDEAPDAVVDNDTTSCGRGARKEEVDAANEAPFGVESRKGVGFV